MGIKFTKTKPDLATPSRSASHDLCRGEPSLSNKRKAPKGVVAASAFRGGRRTTPAKKPAVPKPKSKTQTVNLPSRAGAIKATAPRPAPPSTAMLSITTSTALPSAMCSDRGRDLDRHRGRYKGVCKRFNNEKGFGYIACDDNSGDLFVHQSEIYADGYRSLAVGEHVEFDIQIQDDGRRKATNVTGPNGAFVKGQPQGGYGGGGGQPRGGYGGGGYAGGGFGETHYAVDPYAEDEFRSDAQMYYGGGYRDPYGDDNDSDYIDRGYGGGGGYDGSGYGGTYYAEDNYGDERERRRQRRQPKAKSSKRARPQNGKVYGYYRCSECRRGWHSAYTFVENGVAQYGQQCKSCRSEKYHKAYDWKALQKTCPKCKALSDLKEQYCGDCGHRFDDKDRHVDPLKNHIQALCARCRHLPRPCSSRYGGGGDGYGGNRYGSGGYDGSGYGGNGYDCSDYGGSDY